MWTRDLGQRIATFFSAQLSQRARGNATVLKTVTSGRRCSRGQCRCFGRRGSELGRAHSRNPESKDWYEDGCWNALSTAGGAIWCCDHLRLGGEGNERNCTHQLRATTTTSAAKERIGRANAKEIVTSINPLIYPALWRRRCSSCVNMQTGELWWATCQASSSSAKPHLSPAWPFCPLMVQTGRCQLSGG
jgi:hypothetical protein